MRAARDLPGQERTGGSNASERTDEIDEDCIFGCKDHWRGH